MCECVCVKRVPYRSASPIRTKAGAVTAATQNRNTILKADTEGRHPGTARTRRHRCKKGRQRGTGRAFHEEHDGFLGDKLLQARVEVRALRFRCRRCSCLRGCTRAARVSAHPVVAYTQTQMAILVPPCALSCLSCSACNVSCSCTHLTRRKYLEALRERQMTRAWTKC